MLEQTHMANMIRNQIFAFIMHMIINFNAITIANGIALVRNSRTDRKIERSPSIKWFCNLICKTNAHSEMTKENKRDDGAQLKHFRPN